MSDIKYLWKKMPTLASPPEEMLDYSYQQSDDGKEVVEMALFRLENGKHLIALYSSVDVTKEVGSLYLENIDLLEEAAKLYEDYDWK